jgi:RES domain-containing protein
MLEGWRIVKAKHARSAFTGDGAAKVGGRWNSRGMPVVYASSTQSLAALESLVHLNPPVLFRYVAFCIRFDEDLLEVVPRKSLPESWSVHPPGLASKHIGDRWVRSARSAVLSVPSTIIAREANYLLNPAHPDFGKITIRPPEPFAFDPRLLK